jgi:NAD(P)-dependent dehydrogenase (short-subunit alcohol dehydrogenase family)
MPICFAAPIGARRRFGNRGKFKMPSIMIIGASRGIGLELARQYTVAGWRVHATTRTPSRPGALGELSGDLMLYELDVRCADHIAAVADALASEALDVLIHNAGVSGRSESRQEVMRINADAPIRVTQALLDAVKRGTEKKVVLMTSQYAPPRHLWGFQSRAQ